MFIKAISLEGFKSYAQRTEISGFDPMFNAITGLNGSGKSNILDGICFVLGITNLSQVIYYFVLCSTNNYFFIV
jgi:structural maintenance of chromosome 2